MQRFCDLRVWKRAHHLTLLIYQATTTFPREERFGITDQIRRAATSVPCNIAEGSKRAWGRDYARFLNLAEGSLAEVRYLLLLSRDLQFLSEPTFSGLDTDAQILERMLCRLRQSVEMRFLPPSTINHHPSTRTTS